MFSRVVAAPPAISIAPAPTNVTSVTKDSGATVSWQHNGLGVTSYTITPYIAGAAQAPTVIAAGSVTTLAGSNGGTFLQTPVAGLTNATAYTFTVKASTSGGSSPESVASGANTPLSGLVFGDDFNGAAGSQVDPEWWVYSRCGFIAQSEVEWYLPSQCVLDGSSNLQLTAQHTSHSGVSYPSDGNTVRNQAWISGACQSNVRTYHPLLTTMTFEVRQQVCADSGNGFWPGLFWLSGQHWLTLWKTDPQQTGWNSTDQAEIDVAEWFPPTAVTNYGNNVFDGSSGFQGRADMSGTDPSAAMHVYQALWKPGVSVVYKRDGVVTNTDNTAVPASGAQFFLLLYLQMLTGGPTTTESCLIDYVRVYDQ